MRGLDLEARERRGGAELPDAGGRQPPQRGFGLPRIVFLAEAYPDEFDDRIAILARDRVWGHEMVEVFLLVRVGSGHRENFHAFPKAENRLRRRPALR